MPADVDETCGHCAAAFTYTDETTFAEAIIMRNRHFDTAHPEIVVRPGEYIHDRATQKVWYWMFACLIG